MVTADTGQARLQFPMVGFQRIGALFVLSPSQEWASVPSMSILKI